MSKTNAQKRIRLWDLPTRVFHWSLALLVFALLISGQIGGNAIDWHARFGVAVAGLLAFRIVWGLAGSTYARFAQFFPTPTSLRAYLRGEWRGVGHNPLGAFSVFGLLALLVLQVATGLFANDDIAFNGYLYTLVSKELSDRLTGIHHLTSDLLIGLVVLHLGAIIFYTHVKKDNLLKPMLTGWKEADEGVAEPARGGGLIALIIALTVAGGAIYAASGCWIPTPPPPPAAAPAAPAW